MAQKQKSAKFESESLALWFSSIDRDTSLDLIPFGLDNEAAVKRYAHIYKQKAYQSHFGWWRIPSAIDPRQARIDAIKAFTRENNDITCEIIEIRETWVWVLLI